MKRVFKRMLGLVVIVTGLLVAAAVAPVGSTKTGAMKWARALTEADRLTYAESARFQSLPVVYREALLGAMETPAHQAELWRGVFREYRRGRQLTPEQDSVLRQAEALVSSLVFSRTRPRSLTDALEVARLAVGRELGPEAALYLYRFQGADGGGGGLPLGERLLWRWRLHAGAVGMAPLFAEDWSCNCTDDSDCYYEQRCKGTQCDPRSSWWGCGPQNWCTKICNYDPVQ